MEGKKYFYNPRTLQYETVRISTKKALMNGLIYLISVIVLSVGFIKVSQEFFESPREKALKRELDQMAYWYNSVSHDFDNMASHLEKIQEKDANVHRLILGVAPMDSAVWNAGIGGHDRYSNITAFKNSGSLIRSTLSKADKLQRKIELQNSSLDGLLKKAKAREEKLASIPSIIPVRIDKLSTHIKGMSGFGYRIHPVHKIRRFHYGMDFTAPLGTSIQATGNGMVVEVVNGRSGYGKYVKVSHGHGYATLYGHMNKINVRVGQKLKKGQVIGTVGNTGLSTAPHLHYEVHYNNKPINPIGFVIDGLSPDEYAEMVKQASVENQSFD